jgi:hypothetical protein
MTSKFKKFARDEREKKNFKSKMNFKLHSPISVNASSFH